MTLICALPIPARDFDVPDTGSEWEIPRHISGVRPSIVYSLKSAVLPTLI
jgi:hypothetical protein